jgi:hypothetical protein
MAGKKPAPTLPFLNDANAEEHYRCVQCNQIGTIDDFDVMGAGQDKVFCNACGFEQELGSFIWLIPKETL